MSEESGFSFIGLTKVYTTTEIVSALKLQEEIKKLYADCCKVYNDSTYSQSRRKDCMEIATAIQSRIEDSEK